MAQDAPKRRFLSLIFLVSINKLNCVIIKLILLLRFMLLAKTGAKRLLVRRLGNLRV